MRSWNPWIIGGIVLLQIMLLVAAFSLGVYVERHGLTREGLVYQGGPRGGIGLPPGVQPQQPQQPAGGPVGLPPGLTEPPQLVGEVLRVRIDLIEVATPQGPRPIMLNEDTVYRDHEYNPLTLADLHAGMLVAIYGQPGSAGREFVASEIVVLASQPGEQPRPNPNPQP